jgi:3-deoxy-D-manno-octulosonic-acid transferase
MDDFADAAALLLDKKGAFQVASEAELEERIVYFIKHKHEYQRACKAALQTANAQQGAARRQVDLIIKYSSCAVSAP